MPPASNEEQFKFLISCIRYSNNGKVDFGEVAKECSIVTKGAAAKRYERMMKAHGISPAGPTPRSTPMPSTPTKKTPGSSSKKRKLGKFDKMSNSSNDDEEGTPTGVKDEADCMGIKEEQKQEADDEDVYTEGPLSFFPNSVSGGDDNADEHRFASHEQNTFSDLIQLGGYGAGSGDSGIVSREMDSDHGYQRHGSEEPDGSPDSIVIGD
ncbi:MAG: hypothetical protein M1819_006506 [Sarea resinae]|nr:MAG: hypothetical protein M1819_006506 [Sarea resinae]